MKKHLSTIILVLLFFVGLSVLCYPSFSNWWNSKTQTRLIEAYDDAVSEMDDEDYSEFFEAADAYNEQIRKIGSQYALSDASLLDNYETTLDITGTGIMGYITISKINVELPIYHGTANSVLQVGAGHLEGSSLPVGGEGTHAVISAHRGLPSSLLFTNLDQLEIGDTFTITVLNEVLTYQVDKISIVLPTEVEGLYIEDGKDYVTLMTCTPYGINTHRLLVRGVRVETVETTHIRVTAEAYKIDPLLIAPIVAAPLLLILLIGVLINARRKRKR